MIQPTYWLNHYSIFYFKIVFFSIKLFIMQIFSYTFLAMDTMDNKDISVSRSALLNNTGEYLF